MSKFRASKRVSPKRVLRPSRIAQAVRHTLRAPHRPWRSMAGLAAVGLVAMSTPAMAAFPPAINLSELDGSNGFVINGINASDDSGHSVSGAGDVNGDGIDDVIIGAPMLFFGRSESYVVFGRTSDFPSALNLSELDGSNGFALKGIEAGDGSGYSVSTAGDVNGDGIDDLIIGSRSAGQGYVVFGRTTGFPPAINLSELDGSNGFVINGINASDEFGHSVSGAGDINGDGIDDVIIGAFGADMAAGESYVVFGRTSDFPSALNVSELDGSNGFALKGIEAGDGSGYSVSTAGDVNGDGIDDLIIGALQQVIDEDDEVIVIGTDENYVVFGRTTVFPSVLNLSDLDGSNGFVINCVDWTGLRSVSSAGDINGDGIDDVIIGAPFADANSFNGNGESHVVFGRTSAFPPAINVPDLDGSNGFVINGNDGHNGRFGWSVSGSGDINGDGIEDVIIGAVLDDRSYVVFGRTTGFPAAINVSDLDGANGFVINGIDVGDRSGRSVSVAGDINGDGIDDVIIGAPRADPNGMESAGQSYVVFGRADNVPINIDIKPGNDRNVINPRSKGGIWVAVLSDTDPDSPFDPPSQVDIPTVELGPDSANANRHKVKDINKDGLGDLLLRFKIPQTGIACGDTEATLTGETFDGQSFTGTDSIKTVGCKPKKCHKKHHNDDRDNDKKHNGKHKEKKYHDRDHDGDHKKR